MPPTAPPPSSFTVSSPTSADRVTFVSFPILLLMLSTARPKKVARMPNPPAPLPSTQIVIDMHGAPVGRGMMQRGEAYIECLYGAGRKQPLFWVTRTDLLHDYVSRHYDVQSLDGLARQHLMDEPRHEPSFDLYCDGGIVPILRIINVAPAQELA